MKKAILIALVAVVVVLAGLAAAWYWAGPWLAQEYIDWQHDGWDVVHVGRYEKAKAVVFIVAVPDRETQPDETDEMLATVGKLARILRFPGFDTIGILLIRSKGDIHLIMLEITAPMEKTDWTTAADCNVFPAYMFGATLKAEYVDWPD